MSGLAVKKTYKLYIGGKFPRTESGRYYPLQDKGGRLLANVCLASRKDFRNAVVAARKAFEGWSGSTAYLRGQILYRIAEMLEGRRQQFVEELQSLGLRKAAAEKEVQAAVDQFVYYAGWTDKYSQLFSSVNPVASPHFNFSRPESLGVVAVCAPERSGLSGLAAAMAPVIAGGNVCVVLASESLPLPAVSLSEALHTSDLPGGVINILTGSRAELIDTMSTHMDVNGLLYCGDDEGELAMLQENASVNIKRVVHRPSVEESPYRIADFQEIKTTWHPIGV